MRSFSLYLKISILTTFQIFALNAAYAVSDDPIIVTADRFKNPLIESTSSITVFTKEDLKKVSNLNDLIVQAPGLVLATSGPSGGSSSLFLRGSDSAHTLVIIDGIIMNDPSTPNRQFDFGRLSLSNIEKIEIIKGSQGLLYGHDAVGGAIIITTKRGDGPTSTHGNIMVGSNSTYKATMSSEGKNDQLYFYYGIDYLQTRGFSAANIKDNPGADDDGQKLWTMQANLEKKIWNDDTIKLNLRKVNDFSELDKGGGRNQDDINDYQKAEQIFGKASYTHFTENTENELAYNQTRHHRATYVLPDQFKSASSTTFYDGMIRNLNFSHTHFLNSVLTQNLLINYVYEEEDQTDKSQESYGVSLNHQFKKDGHTITIGGRLDHNQNFNDYGTYKISYGRHFIDWSWHISHGSGHKAPSINQLFDATYGNKDLTPEKSQSSELGARWQYLDKQELQTTVFFNEVKNRLSYHPTTYVNLNSGKARMYGIEGEFKNTLTSNIKTQIATTWLRAYDVSSKEKLKRRPNLNGELSIITEHDSHFSRISYFYQGKRNDSDSLGSTVQMTSYGLLSFDYSYLLNANTKVYLKLKNILNKKYEEVYGYGTSGRGLETGANFIF